MTAPFDTTIARSVGRTSVRISRSNGLSTTRSVLSDVTPPTPGTDTDYRPLDTRTQEYYT